MFLFYGLSLGCQTHFNSGPTYVTKKKTRIANSKVFYFMRTTCQHPEVILNLHIFPHLTSILINLNHLNRLTPCKLKWSCKCIKFIRKNTTKFVQYGSTKPNAFDGHYIAQSYIIRVL